MPRTRTLVALLLPAVVGASLAVAVPSSVADEAPSASAIHSCTRAPEASPLQKVCMSLHVRLGMHPAVAGAAADVIQSSYAYTPAELRNAYNLPAAHTRAVIALVDAYGDSSLERDLAVYRSHLGLPACLRSNGCLTVLNEFGGSALPADPKSSNPEYRYIEGWRDETELDAEMVSAICATCRILVVQATDDDASGTPNLEQATYTASKHADFVSMSWGGAEYVDQTTNDRLLFHPGVVFTAAAGDSSYSAGASWPASDPDVVSVGGTRLEPDSGCSTGGRCWTESAWYDDADDATASGCSQYETQPTWQTGVVASDCAKRAENDVSMVADPATGLLTYTHDYQWGVSGGTSASAPMVAAVYALGGLPSTAEPSPALPYAHTNSLYDVVSGSNSATCASVLCHAQAGWDGPTGLGTPNGVSAFATGRQPGALTLRNPGTTTGQVGRSRTISVAATRGTDVRYYARGLAPGTRLSGGNVVGAPTRTGSFAVRVSAIDGTGATGSRTFTYRVGTGRLIATSRPRVSGRRVHRHAVRLATPTFRADSRSGSRLSVAKSITWYLNGRVVSHRARYRLPRNSRHKRLSIRFTAGKAYYGSYSWRVRLGRVR